MEITRVSAVPIFLDAECLVILADEAHPTHNRLLGQIDSGVAACTVTTEQELDAITRYRSVNPVRANLISITWKIWNGEFSKIVEPSEEELELAWESYMSTLDTSIQFRCCLADVLSKTHGFERFTGSANQ